VAVEELATLLELQQQAVQVAVATAESVAVEQVMKEQLTLVVAVVAVVMKVLLVLLVVQVSLFLNIQTQ
jgi:hypothetical protein